jgi:hypothetical protein
MLKITELNTAKIEEYIKQKNGGDYRKRNLIASLSQFCNWCVRKGHLKSNPAESEDLEITIKLFHNKPLMEFLSKKTLLPYSNQHNFCLHRLTLLVFLSQ